MALLETFQLTQSIPKRNLGEGERPWEVASGTLVHRLAKNGVMGLQFARRLGIEPQVIRDLVDRVRARGRQSLHLILDQDVAAPRVESREGGTNNPRRTQNQDGEAFLDVIPEELFERASALRIQANWDTRLYVKNDVIASCNLLVEEIMAGDLCERTVVALRMLEILCRRHSQAKLHIGREMEGLIRTGLPNFAYAMTTYSFRLAYVFQTLAPQLALEMTRYNVIERILKVMLWESDLAARLIQNRVRVARSKRKISSYPADVRTRYMIGFNSVSSDLNRQWRRLRASVYHVEMTAPLRTTYMRTLHALTKAGSSKYFRSNRRRVVEVGGLLFLRSALQGGEATITTDHDYLKIAARLLLCELAREPSLLLPILEANVIQLLVGEVASAVQRKASSPSSLLCTLKTINYMALSAFVHSATASRAHPWLAQCVAYGLEEDSPGLREAEQLDLDLMPKARTELLAAARTKLITPMLLECLISLAISAASTDVFSAAVIVLHSVSCVSPYAQRTVLDQLTQQGCVTYEKLLRRGLEGGDRQSACSITALFLQACSSDDARHLLVGRGIVKLLPAPTTTEEGAHYESLVSISAMRCIVGLLQVGDGLEYLPWHLEHLLLAKEAGNKVADIRDALYGALHALAKDGEEGMRESIRLMKRLRLTHEILSYLVRPLTEPLSFACQAKGNIVLHHMYADPEVALSAPEHLLRRMVEHLLAFIDEGVAKALSSESTSTSSPSWVLIGLRAALLAFCRLTESLGSERVLARVWSSVHRHNLLSSLRGLLDASFLHIVTPRPALQPLQQITTTTTTAAAATSFKNSLPRIPKPVIEAVLRMIEHLAQLPAYETAAEAKTEPGKDPREAEEECEASLLQLCEVFVPPISAFLRSYPQRNKTLDACLAAALACFARLATTYRSCIFLLDADILTTLRAISTIDHHHGGSTRRRDLPSSYYQLLACLARLPALRPRLHNAFLRDAVARLSDSGRDMADAETKAHVLMLVARLAHVHTTSSGHADDLLLNPHAMVIATIISALAQEQTRPGEEHCVRLLRYCAASAVASLMRDVLKVVPRFVTAGIIKPLVEITGDSETPHPLLRRALEGLHLIATHPGGAFHEALEGTCIRQSLFRVANSKDLCRGPKAQTPLGHLASEILLLIDKRSGKHVDQEEGGGQEEQEDQASSKHEECYEEFKEYSPRDDSVPRGMSRSVELTGHECLITGDEDVTTAPGRAVVLPAHHAHISSGGTYVEYGSSACGPLSSPEARGYKDGGRKHLQPIKTAEGWRERYWAAVRESHDQEHHHYRCEHDQVLRPPGPAPHFQGPSYLWQRSGEMSGGGESGGEHGKAVGHSTTSVANAAHCGTQQEHRQQQQQQPPCKSGNLIGALDPIFMSPQEDGPSWHGPCSQPRRAAFLPSLRHVVVLQASHYKGHLVVVECVRRAGMSGGPHGQQSMELSETVSTSPASLQEIVTARQLQRLAHSMPTIARGGKETTRTPSDS